MYNPTETMKQHLVHISFISFFFLKSDDCVRKSLDNIWTFLRTSNFGGKTVRSHNKRLDNV